MTMEVIPLFSSPLYIDNDGKMPDVTELASGFSFEKVPSGGALTQYPNVLARMPKEFVEWTNHHIKQYVYAIQGISQKHDIQVTNSWISKLNDGEAADSHDHTNSMFSGVIFLTAPEGSSELIFNKNQYKMIEPDIDSWNMYNSSLYKVTPQQGMICIFPSHLVHYVPQGTNLTPRMSLSFNIFIRGLFGIHTKSLDLR